MGALGNIFSIILAALPLTLAGQPPRVETCLEKGWYFTKGDPAGAEAPQYDHSGWERVTVPHDWAIFGPFDRDHDLQVVAVTQNFETDATVKTGRTGGLPYVGMGWYRRELDLEGFDPARQRAVLLFDGAMSEARVYVNGHQVCFWLYGYNSFYCDITPYVEADGNILSVRLENKPQLSRWYPGAGLYRNVHLIVTEKVAVPVWGTYITTPHVSEEFASVNLKTTVENVPDGKPVRIVTAIVGPDGRTVATRDDMRELNHGRPAEQNFIVRDPQLWSPETPHLYHAVSEIYLDGRLCDTYTTRFGIREVKVIAEKGFYLNGQRRKFQGVNNHHDLGPLGAAVNVSALRKQLVMLKEMGCDAVRTAHNMPAPELVALCDEMGFMVMVEPFDEWDVAKCDNGYHRFFDEWAERDMVNMIRNYRNNPSVVMWSIGNEVPTQCVPDGYRVASFLQDICHREDPTRPVTCGMDQVDCVLDNGFAAMLDVPGFNYRAHHYEEAYARLPQGFVLGSETTSTVSSRGVYKFPPEIKADAIYPDHQSSSYDLEHCSWSNIPDIDLALAEDHEWTMGQFVWTGFDYLGEPSPYDTDAWPSHSSLFGIIDLASIPKDRYYLYRSVWNSGEHTLHVLPHWTWPGREGEVTPVYVYTNHPSAELFVNGVSQGRRFKDPDSLTDRFRLRWNDVVYTPGELRVVAYDDSGNPCGEQYVRTAGKAHRLVLTPDRMELTPDGKDLAYVNVSMVDKDGNLCPFDDRLVTVEVTGAGTYRASANGDPASLDLFHLPQMHLFSGQMTAIVCSGEEPGTMRVTAKAKGVSPATVTIEIK